MFPARPDVRRRLLVLVLVLVCSSLRWLLPGVALAQGTSNGTSCNAELLPFTTTLVLLGQFPAVFPVIGPLPVDPDVQRPFNIELVVGAGLAANPQALAAFERAARQWEQRITDPITVRIAADLRDLTHTIAAGSLGVTDPDVYMVEYGRFSSRLRADSASEVGEAVVQDLPASSVPLRLPDGVSFNGKIAAKKANLKALGCQGLDQAFGLRDATIVFNSSGLVFDYDAGDGVAPQVGPGLEGPFDFETLAAHEIGHALGFVSSLEILGNPVIAPVLLQLLGNRTPVAALDLYRFSRDAVATAGFGIAPRNIRPGEPALFDDGDHDLLALSTGAECSPDPSGAAQRCNGASHWLDDRYLTASGTLVQRPRVGLMDPTQDVGEVTAVHAADLRVLDLIGYDIRTAEAAPAVSVAANGVQVERARVASGAPIRLSAVVLDDDGLGFPVFFELSGGAALGRATHVWNFAGGQALDPGLGPLSPNPAVRYALAAGESRRTFTASVTTFDALGDSTVVSLPIDVVAPTPPTVLVSANGAPVVGPLSVRSGAEVQFTTNATDADGLGYPILMGFGSDGPVRFLWDFGGATPLGGVFAGFQPNPRVSFELPAGVSARAYSLRLQVVDGIGSIRSVPIQVNVTR